MRTQLILTTAALGLAGAFGAQAQVYSVNAVGYINVTVPAGKFAIVANQLNTGGNKITEVIPTAKDFSTVYLWDPAANGGKGAYVGSDYAFGEWSDKNLVLAPGKAFFFFNGDAANQTVTFVGEVPQGELKTPLETGLNLAASQVPQEGKIATDLNFPTAEFDTVYLFKSEAGTYDTYSFAFGAWDPAEPSLKVGQGAFIQKSAKASWDRTFTVK